MRRATTPRASRTSQRFRSLGMGPASLRPKSDATPLKLSDVPDLPNVSQSLTPPTPPLGVKARRVTGMCLFPQGVADSTKQWAKRGDLARAESRVLELNGLEPGPNESGSESKNISFIDTPVGPKLFLNELQIVGPSIEGQANQHIVLIHGYGAAKGFFFRNFGALGSIPGYTLHALDLLGYGRSSRPKFKVKAETQKDGVNRAEEFFVESLEEWRKQKGIDRFTLLAHSLGAYVGGVYALQYPEHVDKLMMISPAGVNRSTQAIAADILGSTDVYDPKDDKEFVAPKWFHWLWERNYSPFALVRNTGPFGPMLTSGWTHSRFSAFDEDTRKAIHEYTYLVFKARGSGEYALNYLLAPGAHGRWPLSERIKDIQCPTLWVYGEKDWMKKSGGFEAVRQIEKHSGQPAEVVVVPSAGHHVYLDNEKDFNKLARDFITGQPIEENELTREATREAANIAAKDPRFGAKPEESIETPNETTQ